MSWYVADLLVSTRFLETVDELIKSTHRVVWLNMDVTQHREIEAALLRSEKLAAAGRMAATVAHEINNPPQAILGNLYHYDKTPLFQPPLVRPSEV